jgi:hypothetical protein
VCTPIGSRFSIEQTITTLSRLSAHDLELELVPARTDSSTSTWPIGLSEQADSTWRSSSARRGKPAAVAAEREGGPDDGGKRNVAQVSSDLTIFDVGTVSPTPPNRPRERARGPRRA